MLTLTAKMNGPQRMLKHPAALTRHPAIKEQGIMADSQLTREESLSLSATTVKYPSIEYVRQCLREDCGRLFWLSRPLSHFVDARAWKIWNTRWSGKEAGCVAFDKMNHSLPRVIISLGETRLFRHVFVWALHKNEWRLGLDHENRNSLDDRIGNLRIATQSQNNANQGIRVDNTSGVKGVTWDKNRNKWMAQIAFRGRHMCLGRFSTLDEASAAYARAAAKYFGVFSNPCNRRQFDLSP